MQATHKANPVSVNATRILEVTDVTDRRPGYGQSSPDLMLRLEDGRNYKANMSMTSRLVPVAGDYLVTQEDGYEYLNPKDVFERKYSAIENTLMVDPLQIDADSLADLKPGAVILTRTADADIESQIKAAGADKAPRITLAGIEAVIKSAHYFTAAGAVRCIDFCAGKTGDKSEPPKALDLLTFCVLVLRNGFTVVGKSACASPENFNADIGRKVARDDAINQVWTLEGYLLKQMLHLANIGGPSEDFPLGQACDLSGEKGCEACQ